MTTVGGSPHRHRQWHHGALADGREPSRLDALLQGERVERCSIPTLNPQSTQLAGPCAPA